MNPAIVDALGWTLIHSLWQCAGIAALFGVLNLMLRRRSANARYLLAYSSILLMPLTAIATFLALSQPPESAATLPASIPAMNPVASASPVLTITPSNPTPYLNLNPHLNLNMVVWFWIAGVIAMSLWSAAGWMTAQRLKHRSKRSLPEFWQSRLAILARQLRVRRGVRLCESALAQVPAVIGWLRPVILIPAGALLNLSAQQLEAVLAHELAHIRRFDYAANLIQSAIETLMFYHPAMWWISRRIRLEREHCCDDLAIAACGDRIEYARALTALEELRGSPQFAMAATGGPLVIRVRRLLGKDDPRRRSLPVWIALATVVIAGLAISSGLRLRAQSTSAPSPQAAETPEPQPVPATPRAKRTPKPSARPAEAPIASAASTSPSAHHAPAATAFVPPTPSASVTPKPEMPEPPGLAPVARPAGLIAQATPAPAAPPAKRDGYLAGLVDAGYTQISVDDIITLRDNGVEPKYIAGMLKAGFGTLTPKDLINLHNAGVTPDYVRRAVDAKVPSLTVERIIHLAQNGVNLENIQRIHAMGFGPFNTDQMIELNNNGISADLFEALKDAGFTKIDAHQAVVAQQNGLSVRSLRSLREQGFKGLTFEQVIKLARAGVI